MCRKIQGAQPCLCRGKEIGGGWAGTKGCWSQEPYPRARLPPVDSRGVLLPAARDSSVVGRACAKSNCFSTFYFCLF